MTEDNFNNWGDRLKKTISDAVGSQNYDKLSENVSDILDSAMDKLGNVIIGIGKKKPPKYSFPIDTEAVPDLMGTWQLILGAFFAVIGGCAMVFWLLMNLVTMGDVSLIPSGVFLVVSVLSGYIAHRGGKRRRLRLDFAKFCELMKDGAVFEIETLARSIRQDKDTTADELNSLINMKAFPEGHIDDEEIYFFGSSDAYREYLESKELEQRKTELLGEEGMAEVRAAIEKGRQYQQTLHQVNDEIAEENMKKKLDEIESILGKIFDRIQERPELFSQVRRLLDYYLPITAKLADAYEDMENQDMQPENIIKSRQEIEKSMDLIKTAYYNLYNDLYADDKVDIVSDISVLRAMFAQEGLTDSDFKQNKASNKNSTMEG